MTVHIGLVGYGNIGRLHHRVIDGLPGARVTAVVRRAGDVPGVRTYRDYALMLADPGVEVVALCTPSGLHAEQAVAALRAGKHVVVEKPFTLDVAEGQRAVREARERGLLLSVISQRRFAPHHVAIKRVIEENRLGRLILGETRQWWRRDQEYYDTVSWRGTVALDGGVLMNQAIHAIDLLRWLMGPVAEVSGHCDTLTHRMEAEDCAVAALRFGSGALGVISATTCMPIGVPADTTVIGELGTVTVRGNDIARWEVPGVPPPGPDEDGGGGENRAMDMADLGHRRQWRDIVDALASGRDPLVTGEDGLASSALVAAIYRSWREGRPVRPEHQALRDSEEAVR